MAENSEISWTDNTWNPWIGCTKVSAGCKNCYAERDFDKRRHVVEWGKGNPRKRTTDAYWKQPLAWNRKAEKEGTRPRVFCASLADWLDPEVPIEWFMDLMGLIAVTPNLDWLLLTKRPEHFDSRMGDAFFEWAKTSPQKTPAHYMCYDWRIRRVAPANVWIGTTVENQKATDRIPHLLSIPARVRFLSCEPLLGPVDISSWIAKALPYLTKQNFEAATARNRFVIDVESIKDQMMCNLGIDWVICGGESGPNARPMHPDWARDLRDQCAAAGVAFHFKQWGEWAPGECAQHAPTKTERTATWFDDKWIYEEVSVEGSEEMHCDDEPDVYRLGVKNAGRLLDGREWNELPKAPRP